MLVYDSPHYEFDCQTRTPLVYEQDPCNNQNFSNDQSPYHSTSLPHQFYCCEYCGGLHDSSNCQIRKPLVYEPNPRNNYDFPSFDPPLQYHIDDSQQFYYCDHCGGPHYRSDCQTVNVFYEHAPYDNHDSSGFDQHSQFTPPQLLPLSELTQQELIKYMIKSQEQFNIDKEKFNMNIQAEIYHFQEMLSLINSNHDPPVDLYDPGGSNDDDIEVTLAYTHLYPS
ncbi:hypothetical protein Tco_1518710 [Tanacetum coccineum]